MKFKPTRLRAPVAERASAGFTLAEVLAALVFMAIVIPVAVEGVRVAGRAGEVGLRKAAAARIAERVLNEQVVRGQTQGSGQGGTIEDAGVQYQWSIRSELWSVDQLNLVTAQVTFPVQGQNYEVHVSTLVDPSASAMTPQTTQ